MQSLLSVFLQQCYSSLSLVFTARFQVPASSHVFCDTQLSFWNTWLVNYSFSLEAVPTTHLRNRDTRRLQMKRDVPKSMNICSSKWILGTMVGITCWERCPQFLLTSFLDFNCFRCLWCTTVTMYVLNIVRLPVSLTFCFSTQTNWWDHFPCLEIGQNCFCGLTLHWFKLEKNSHIAFHCIQSKGNEILYLKAGDESNSNVIYLLLKLTSNKQCF